MGIWVEGRNLESYNLKVFMLLVRSVQSRYKVLRYRKVRCDFRIVFCKFFIKGYIVWKI